MQRRTLGLSCLFAAALALAPGAVAAQDTVGGQGPRIAAHGHPPVATDGRPVFVSVDGLAQFGHWPLASAPPLLIRVEGDVEITRLPDGSLRFALGSEDE